jgi:hypothetical protein
MVLPFFAVGWGSYSNRFLLPAACGSLIVAAIMVTAARPRCGIRC